MSTNPVQAIGPAGEAHLADDGLRPKPSQAAAKTAQPDPATLPKQEMQTPPSSPPPLEVPQDEVQVQRDSATQGEIVVRYVDRSGDVILQVPSSQVLGMIRAIDQDFAQAAKARATEEGDKNHGH